MGERGAIDSPPVGVSPASAVVVLAVFAVVAFAALGDAFAAVDDASEVGFANSLETVVRTTRGLLAIEVTAMCL